jgi:plastocyanin
MRRWSVVVLAASLLGLFWLAPVTLAADEDVTIAGFAFSPETVTVSVGDTVTWTNNDGATHTATADDGEFDTDNIAGGGSESVTFDTAGTFAYHCEIHNSMTGAVVVEAAGGTATAPPTDTAEPTNTSPGGGWFAGLATLFVVAASLIVGRRLARASRQDGRGLSPGR